MKTYLTSGIFKKFNSAPKSVIGLKDFNKIFKELLNYFQVGNADQCCPLDPTTLPVRYNKTLGRIEYFDNITLTYIDVPTP